jgi:hypothetical protein
MLKRCALVVAMLAVQVTLVEASGFELKKLSNSADCNLLYEGQTLVTRREKKGPTAYGIGRGCPSQIQGQEMRIRKHRTLTMGPYKNYVVMYGFADKKTNVVWKLVIRKPTGADVTKKTLGRYIFNSTKIK